MSARAHAGPLFKAWSRTGAPLASGRVWAYEAGTSTPKATFQDPAGTAAHTHPIVLDGAGEAAVFWGTGLYKVRVEDAAGVLQWEVDGFDPQVIDLPAPSLNLIANGSFEADTDGDGVPDGWTFTAFAGGTVDVDRYDAGTNPAPDVLHGEAALRLVSPGGAGKGGGYADTSDFFEVAEGEDLDVAFWIKASAAGVHNQVDVRWFTSAQAAHGTPQTTVYDEAAANPAAWTEMRYRVTPPSGARFARVRLYGCIDDDAIAGTTRYDHVTVRTAPPQYLRSDVADQADGVLTFAAAPLLNNAVLLTGRNTGGAGRSLIGVNALDEIRVGDGAMPLKLVHNGTLVDGSNAVLWTDGNDGPGSGLDADLLDGVHGAAFVRSDVADQVDGVLTFAAAPTLSNAVGLLGRETGGTTRNLANVNGSNEVVLGDGSVTTRVRGAALTFGAADSTVWHAGNHGPGSGLDADLLDGLEGAAYGRLIQEVTGRNPSPVTVTGGLTTLVDVTVGPVAVGQRILVNGFMKTAKGATAGTTILSAAPLGDPVACLFGPFDNVNNILAHATYQPAGETFPLTVYGVFRVINAQSGFTFRLTGVSKASDGAVGADDAGLLVRVVNA
jgi:hypothetical protein